MKLIKYILIIQIIIFSGFKSVHGNHWLVTNSNDNGAGSLREIITSASDYDTILFDGDMEIVLSSVIYIENKSLVIDGSGNAIVINGDSTTKAFNVLFTNLGFFKINNITIKECMSTDNFGGAFNGESENGNILISNCRFINNHGRSGGAVSSRGPTEIINSVFIGNHCTNSGGGVYGSNSVSILNCTFVENSSNDGGNEDFYLYPNCLIQNCIIYNKENEYNSSHYPVIRNVAVINPIVFNGIINLESCPFVTEPSFGVDSIWGTNDDIIDLTLNNSTQCINSGSIDNISFLQNDIAGNPRIQYDYIDLGAYESSYNNIPYSLYKNITVSNNSSDIFEPNSLPWAILHLADSGDISFNNDFTIDFSYPIKINHMSLSIDGENHNIVLDGMDTTNLFSLLSDTLNNISLKNLTLQNGNNHDGGAIHIEDYGGKIEIQSCKFIQNWGYNGGAINIYGRNVVYHDLQINDCEFIRNTAYYLGGGIYVDGYSKTFANRCSFIGNKGVRGGAIYSDEYHTYIFNSIFIGNEVTDDGGGIFGYGYVYNCTFSKNFAKSTGPAIYSESISVFNSLLYDNPVHNPPGYDPNEHYKARLRNCKVKKYNPDDNGNLTVNPFRGEIYVGNDSIWGTNDDLIDVRLTEFSECVDSGMTSFGVGGGFYPFFYRDPLTYSLIVGFQENEFYEAGNIDFLGNKRVLGDVIDIGATEFESNENVDSIVIFTTGDIYSINKNNDSLQFYYIIYPNNLDNDSVMWSIIEETGSAIINQNGLLFSTGDVESNGNIIVKIQTKLDTSVTAEQTVMISGQIETSINNILAQDNFYLFPNPSVDGSFFIKNDCDLELKECKIRLYDIYGRAVYCSVIPDINNSYFSTNLKDGVYIVEIISGSYTWKQKLLIK